MNERDIYWKLIWKLLNYFFYLPYSGLKCTARDYFLRIRKHKERRHIPMSVLVPYHFLEQSKRKDDLSMENPSLISLQQTQSLRCIKVKFELLKSRNIEEMEEKVRWKFHWLTRRETNYILFERDASDDEKGPKMVCAENKKKLLWANKTQQNKTKQRKKC